MSTKTGNIFLCFKRDGETENKAHLACLYEIPEELQEKITNAVIVDRILKSVEKAKEHLIKVNLPYSAETCAKILYIDMPEFFGDCKFKQNIVELLCDHLYYIEVETDGYAPSFSLRGYNVRALGGRLTKAHWTDLYLEPDACQRLAEEFDQEVEVIGL